MNIIGLGGLARDPACAVLVDGRLVAAVEQRKVSHRHTAARLPLEAIQTALHLAGIAAADVGIVALARPFADSAHAPDFPIELRTWFSSARVVTVEHHQAHAASAYYASPFDQATVLTLDRAGDFRC